MDIIIDQVEEEEYQSKTMPQAVAELERSMMIEKINELTSMKGVNYSQVAIDLGISRGTCLNKRKKFDL